MKPILVYGDSLSWGIIPETRQRFAFDQRWPVNKANGFIYRESRIYTLFITASGTVRRFS